MISVGIDVSKEKSTICIQAWLGFAPQDWLRGHEVYLDGKADR